MKKLIALLLVAVMMLPVVSAMAATEFDVTEPITIEWWHAHESQFDEQIKYMVDKFNAENDMGITVVPRYMGAYAEIDTAFRAADAADAVPALVCCNTSNNNGYHSIRITQTNLFSQHCKVGIGPESGDLSFPEFRKIAEAFGYRYFCARSNAEMKQVVDEVLTLDGPVFTEIFTDTIQVWEPKNSTKRLPDGTLVSPPLEDLAPFLPREELEKIMVVPMMEED